jgi:GNAT superfamily N-acetyltransferase
VVIVDQALAARLEDTLTGDVRSFVAAVAELDPSSGAAEEAVAGGWALCTGAGRFGNRAQGAGIGAAVTAAELDRVDAFYRARDLMPEYEVCPLADPSLLAGVVARGHRAVSFRNVYAHDLSGGAPASHAFEVSVVDDDVGFRAWSETLLDGFGYTSAEDRARVGWWNRMLCGLPDASLLLARVDGEPVGVANVLVRGRTASLGGTATRPEHRRRGAQAALLAARLDLAREAGCTLAVITADPGGTSARNCERAGFRLAYTNVRFRGGRT